MKTPQHWFITGVSGGLGRALAIEVLSKGGTVTGILRKEEKKLAVMVKKQEKVLFVAFHLLLNLAEDL